MDQLSNTDPSHEIKLLLESRSNKRMVGPATVVESVASVPLLVASAYTWPDKSLGTSTSPSVMGTKILSRPVKNTIWLAVASALLVTLDLLPGTGLLKVREGKAFTGSAGFDDGQDVMNGAARVKTWFSPRGT